MPQFRYKALNEAGRTDVGLLDAADDETAYMLLKGRGLNVFELEPGGRMDARPWYLQEVSLSGNRHKLANQAAVAELFGLLADLNLPITQTLDIVAERAGTPAIRAHMRRMRDTVADGQGLAASFDSAGGGFSPLFSQALLVAEKSNTLPHTMRDLARLLRQSENIRTKIAGALIYPAMLLISALFLVLIIAMYLAPALAPMFSALERPMPALLSGLLWIGQSAQNNVEIILPILLVFLVLSAFVALAPPMTRLRHILVDRIPLVSDILREGHLQRHVSALAMLLRSGAALPEALNASAQVQPSSRYAQGLVSAADSLNQGGRASEGLRESGKFPELALGLFDVGEEANRLPEVCTTLSNVLEQSVERKTSRALQLLTPVLTLIIGGIIGALVYVIMSAILDINALAL